MDYTRQRDWFDPDKTDARVTIVGCGGIGSFAAFALAKLGVQHFDLIDMDTVEEHNLPNQFFMMRDLGMPKVEAVRDQIELFTDLGDAAIRTHNRLLQEGVPLNDVVLSALDSMEARADLWELVKYKLNCRLFLDARLGGEYIVLYSLNPCDPKQIAAYEATLHTDEEGLELPCTARSVIDVGFAVASLIARAVRKHYASEPLTPQVFLNQSTLALMSGEWI